MNDSQVDDLNFVAQIDKIDFIFVVSVFKTH